MDTRQTFFSISKMEGDKRIITQEFRFFEDFERAVFNAEDEGGVFWATFYCEAIHTLLFYTIEGWEIEETPYFISEV